MFDFAWTEIALVGVVALIAIGPKDLPVAMKTVAQLVKKARRMAGEFQTHLDEMMREANLHEVRDTITDLRRMDIKGKILNAVDSDGGLRKTVADNPFDIKPAPPPVPVHDTPAVAEQAVEAYPEHSIVGPGTVPGQAAERAATPAATGEGEGAPAFIPPQVARAGLPGTSLPPPAFLPPSVTAQAAGARRARQYA